MFSAFGYTATAQLYQNEWIDYNKTYYKFKVGSFGYDTEADWQPLKKGVVRIPQSTLAAAGLGSVPAEQFQLWTNGEEVPIYVSKSSGILSSNDYIEFWGEMANGKPDKQLYADNTYQLDDYWNLYSDSSAYFLTVNPAGNNKRFQTVANNVSGTNLQPEKNFMYTMGRHFYSRPWDPINEGFGVQVEVMLHLSAFDKGEGFSSRAIHKNGAGDGQMPETFYYLHIDTTGAPMTATFNMTGSAPYNRNVKLWMNGDSLIQFPMGYYESVKKAVSIPANRIKDDFATTFVVQNLATANADEMRVVAIELQYPRFFDFAGILGAASSFEFNVDPSSNGRYLKITNFDRGTGNAILYDITNGKRYIADTTVKDTLQFVLQPSTEKYHLVLVREDGSAAKTIGSIQQKQYINYTQTTNQGDYLIISNPRLYGSGSNNYIEQYADYRSSDTGGHFNVKIVDVHELEDQFAYGISLHPLSIKNFLRFARNKFTAPPAYAFLIGKGISYVAYRYNETDPLTKQLNLIPVFGNPGSDNLLSADNYEDIPATPIGRLSAVTPEEVGAYLQKIKEYESAQRDTIHSTVADRLWMKKVLQLAGANDVSIGAIIDSFQTKYGKIIGDTAFGGNALTYSKSADPSGYAKSLFEFTNEYNNGSALLEYLGHSSSTSIDFSLDNPANYDNAGKYPVFIVNGCLAGNIFDYDVNRFNNRSTLSEKFVLEPERGAIGYLSSSSYGVLSYLDIFTEQFYKSIASRRYGKGFGEVIKDGIKYALDYTGYQDFYARMHAEQFTFHGDPALKINSFSLPDYAVDSSEMSVTPGYLTVASDSFTVKLQIHNLGKAINDSVHFVLLRKYPNGNSETVFSKNLSSVKSSDTLEFKLPVVANRDKGTTEITAIINDNNQIAELSKKNNTASVKVKISASDLLPVSPYNYSIINTNTVDLSASTAYAFDSATKYVMELDTTALFNSPTKISQTQVSKGGLITFSNVSLLLNNTVYYWRVSEDSADKHWSSFSFIYRNGGTTGFEQAHFYQHTQSTFDGVTPDSTLRAFDFSKAYSNLFIVNSIYGASGDQDAQFSISQNGSIITWSACVGYSIIFNVFDPKTLKPILDTTLPFNAGWICDSMRRYNYEYGTTDPASRKNAMDFLDHYVQNGYYVVARKIYDSYYGWLENDWAPTVWAADTALYGHNNSLYHRFKDQGLAIDSFIYPRTFIFVFKKNDSANFKPVSIFSQGLYDRISTSQNIPIVDSAGTVTSPLFGPGKAWNKVKWYGAAENKNNYSSLDVITVDKNGKDSVWYTIDTSQHERDISTINATQYPYVKLRMYTKDGVTAKPYQLKDWSVELTPVPEGAIATNLGVSLPDTVKYGHDVHVAVDPLKGDIVFKNVSTTAFTPLKIKLVLYDESNVAYNFTLPRTRSLPSGDTVHVSFNINVTDLPQGKYNLYLEVNPDNDQPEQYHYNNFIYHYVYIDRESVLPVHLINFTAKPVNNNVQLQWTVANEINIARYEVEFSKDGRTFNKIGNTSPTDIHVLEKIYSFLHTGAINGKNYYRLKIVDADGKFTYSPVRIVIMGSDAVLVYPNPFHSQLNIVNSNGGAATVRLLDLTGKQLLQQTFEASTALNVNNLASGVYIVQVNDGINVRSFKVYKK